MSELTVEVILADLDGHAPEGDYDGYVAYCECGWDGTDSGGDYRTHAAEIIASAT